VKQIQHFQVYADYGANYDLIARDIEETQQNIAAWPDFDRAIELLSATVNPVRTREQNHKKALSVKDLLIKVSQTEPDPTVTWLTLRFKADPTPTKIRAFIQ
jgi:hypothetical protein